jgi:hypothetical protein
MQVSASDPGWWARKLGQVLPPAPVAPAQPVNGGYPAKAVRWQPQYPPTGPRQEVAEWGQPEGNGDTTYNRVRSQGYDAKAPSSVGKTGKCPGCGGSNYFHRKGPMGMEAAPICTDCGHNGELFTQSGTLLNAVGMKSSGPIQFARSDNAEGTSHFEADPNVPSEFSWGNVR